VATSQNADLIIIGGGLIGCAIALRLAQAGRRVCVLERGEPGCEASSAAAGMLAPQGETVEPDAFYELCAASRDLYPAFIEEVRALSGANIDYHRDGTLLVAANDAERRELETAYAAQSRIGLPIERLAPEAARQRVPGLSPTLQYSLFVPGDHWLDNEQLCVAVAAACARLGVQILPHHSVTGFEMHGERLQSLKVREAGSMGGERTFGAGEFVLAAGCWSAALTKPHGIKLAMQPCHGQMLEFDVAHELPCVVRAGHHYLVPRSGNRVVAGTTAEWGQFEKAVTGEGMKSILEGVTRFAPFVKEMRFRRAWSGLRPDTADHLPILGRGEIPNLLFATGHFRNGILLAPITAEIISDLVVRGSSSRPIDAYRPRALHSTQ
jgi:glycine oxidase